MPSPTAATVHALHYHYVSVPAVQAEIAASRDRCPGKALTTMLQPPLVPGGAASLDASAIDHELDACAQGILGYVVRWIEHGVGCSKVPDLRNIGMMEDRATLRISSQMLANWLHHGVVTRSQVVAAFTRWAAVVDKQNAGDKVYRPMCANLDASIA